VLQNAGKQCVGLAVVERDVRRGAHHHDHLVAVEAELRDHGVIRLEVVQVVLLFQPRKLDHLRPAGAVTGKPLRRNRVRGHHARSQAAADVVLLGRELVVEHVHLGKAQGG